MPLNIVQVQSGQLALADADGNILGIIDDSGIKKLIAAAQLHDGTGFYKAALESGGNLALIKAKTDNLPSDPAREGGNLSSLLTVVTAIRDTAGIKKILDALPAGTNTIGKVDQGVGGASAWLVQGGGGDGSTQVEGRGAAGAAPVGNPVYVAGYDGSLLRALLTDARGRLVLVPPGVAADQAGFSFGDVTTSTTTLTVVRRTAYTEQTSDAQRSIASASASDAAAGTGARTVRITYYTAAFAGPYTETLTLNGTTGVNTVATNICYIERIEVLTAGSGGANAGIITLYSAANKGGVAVGTIAVGDNRTYWAHHHVPTGRVCRITSQLAAHNGTVVGSGGVFHIRYKDLGTTNSVDRQITDFLRLYGQSSSVSRNYGTPIVIPGPARLTTWVLPESTSSVIYRASFDFYEDQI